MLLCVRDACCFGISESSGNLRREAYSGTYLRYNRFINLLIATEEGSSNSSIYLEIRNLNYAHGQGTYVCGHGIDSFTLRAPLLLALQSSSTDLRSL